MTPTKASGHSPFALSHKTNVVLPIKNEVRSERVITIEALQSGNRKWEAANSKVMKEAVNMLEELRLMTSH